ncbi:MAG: hypothetical protein EBX36_13405, partial [Planctomycetia bacterium]|nr:hypothetical protein [Planctomycetia bacterium]
IGRIDAWRRRFSGGCGGLHGGFLGADGMGMPDDGEHRQAQQVSDAGDPATGTAPATRGIVR